VTGTPSLRQVAALVLIVAFAVGCRPESGGSAGAATTAADARSVVVRPIESPARVGDALVEVEVRLDGAPVEGAQVRVVGDMTHAGMVPVLADAEHVGDGVYRTVAFAFTMSGDWMLTAEVTFPDGSRRNGEALVRVQR
jgi:hypothetical protein